ncbi:MAG: DUF3553 domain-containing protein [Rhodobacter sp.]|nr:DUF3553 domain-containing protein [Rhodobacter sp.]MCA3514811.1 DUF3553 domain-containing protein [Rhodobacter sp.]MCA3520213.1 DUF3553 domain-containing protein [Rhodobacter sp.]MCA3522488.1 DUF3553 domain-containing protein [Rhodobacter sp.]MCA3527276.1 DUF3553 domain-containing protein [Rhodobacter sp.]
MNAVLEPGMLVRHPGCPEWGLGQVQSNIGGRITVNFEHQGKVVIDGSRVDLLAEWGGQDQANRLQPPSARVHSDRVEGPGGCRPAVQALDSA